MERLTALAGLAAVMALSLPLALGLEWLCLRGAFRLLPSRAEIPLKSAATKRSKASGFEGLQGRILS